MDWYEPEGSDVDKALEGMHIDLAERVRKFGRNFFTAETEYLTKETLRQEYTFLVEVLVRDLASEKAVIVMNGLLKPSYQIQRDKFDQVEV